MTVKKVRIQLKKVMALIITLLMCMSSVDVLFAVAATEAELIYSGDCSTEESTVLWEFYDNGTLYINGNGDMADRYAAGDDMWWETASSDVESVVISEGVTSICASAFEAFSALKEVIISDTISIIGDMSFADTAINEITIPDSVISVGVGVFSHCMELEQVTIGNGLTEIVDNMFESCHQLRTVEIPDTVTRIGDLAFGYTQVEEIEIPDGVTYIGDSAFSNTQIRQISIPDSVTEVGSDVFSGCSQLETVEIGTGLTEIGEGMFEHTRLTEFNIPDSVRSIGNNAFSSTNITEITIPDSVTSVGDGVFAWCYDLESVIIPEGVTSIGNRAFSYCYSLREINIPQSVISIGSNAFAGCDTLAEITIPKGVTNIGSGVLTGCSGLQRIIVEKGNSEFYADPTGVLFNKDQTVLIQYPSGRSDTRYDIPESVLTVGESAFEDALNIKSVTMGNDVVTLEAYAFDGCEALTEIKIARNLLRVGNSAFSGCESLKEIKFPRSVSSIGRYALYGCESLEKVTILNAECSIYDESRTIYESATIYGQNNSTAKTYADNYGRTFNLFVCTHEDVEISEDKFTCTQGGYSAGKFCYDCVKIVEGFEWVEATGHIYKDYKSNNDATCFADGTETAKCIYDCGETDTRIDEGSKLQHSFTQYTSDNNANCEEDGTKTACCDSGCGTLDTVNDDGTALGHLFTVYTSDNNSTCGKDGTKTALCDRNCGKRDSITEEGTKLEHSFTNYVSDNNITCEEYGTKTAYCDWGCGAYDTVIDQELAPCHSYSDWYVSVEASCEKEGVKVKECSKCDKTETKIIEKLPHEYTEKVAAPTYFEWGYTEHTCSNCGSSYTDSFVDALERTELSKAEVELEYTSVYYKGELLTPGVTVKYDGEVYSGNNEFKITYANNNKVGTATVTVEGINRFKGSVQLQFEISYEVVPQKIVNVVAFGDIGKIILSWAESSEVNTNTYKIYRKAENESKYTLLTTSFGRNILSIEDKDVQRGVEYTYYVTGVGLYGAESEPSDTATAMPQIDVTPPTIIRVTPSAKTVINNRTTFGIKVSDNIGVERAAFYYSLDNADTWVLMGESYSEAPAVSYDTSLFEGNSVKIKTVVYDAEGNASEVITSYSLDKNAPEKVKGVTGSSNETVITIKWNKVIDNDAEKYHIQQLINSSWNTVASVSSLGVNLEGFSYDTAYTFRVACEDRYGNLGEYSDEITVETAKDTTAPVITKLSPSPRRVNNSLSFSAQAKDTGGIAEIKIQASYDLETWVTVAAKEYSENEPERIFTQTLVLDNYDEGSIYLRAVATDFYGNEGSKKEDAPFVEYYIDRTAPSAPTDIRVSSNEGYINIAWEAGKESDLRGFKVYRAEAEDGEYKLIASVSTINYIDYTAEIEKIYYYKVASYDAAGNNGELSDIVSASLAPDKKAPEMQNFTVTPENKVGGSIKSVSVYATDNYRLRNIVIEYCFEGEKEYKELAREEFSNTYYGYATAVIPVDKMKSGEKIFLRAYAVDEEGLNSNYTNKTYIADQSAPVIENMSVEQSGTDIILNWTCEKTADHSGFMIYLENESGEFVPVGSKNYSEEGKFSFVYSVDSQENKKYTFKIRSFDNIGNYSEDTTSIDYIFNYENEVPTAKMDVPDIMVIGVEKVFDATFSSDDISITDYLWNFGDGTTSEEVQAVKKYDSSGTYTVTLTVTDNEGETSVIEKDILVKEREQIGTLNIKVVDEDKKSVPFAGIYLDLGTDRQTVIYADATGVASVELEDGIHNVGIYHSGYLPVKKEVVVLGNATRTITFNTVKQEIVTGEFEWTRMTLDEIKDAGIDPYEPQNQQIYIANVDVQFGRSSSEGGQFSLRYYKNEDSIFRVMFVDDETQEETPVFNDDGSSYQAFPIDKDVVAVLEIPTKATFLKEFFDVKLHIINHASSDFELTDNEVVLNVPAGMTLMQSVGPYGYNTSNLINIDSIKGQETVTLSWILRGDDTGEYDLTANFCGILSQFNELVTAQFVSDVPIKVYGLDGVTFRLLTADEVHGQAFYFNLELENNRDIDLYMPSLGLHDKVRNITESFVYRNIEGDFDVDSYLLNAYVQLEDGEKRYVPISYDNEGNPVTNVELLVPGQKLVYEYAVYNAIIYDDVAYFRDYVIIGLQGMSSNFEVDTFHKELYSFDDYEEKANAVTVEGSYEKYAFEHITDEDYYYYVAEADSGDSGGICRALYNTGKLVMNGDTSGFSDEDKKDLIEQSILNILCDSSTIEDSLKFETEEYKKAIDHFLEELRKKIVKVFGEEYADIFDSILYKDDPENKDEFIKLYIRDGSAGLYEQLYAEFKEVLDSSSAAEELGDSAKEFFCEKLGITTEDSFKKTVFSGVDIAKSFLDVVDETKKDMAIAAILRQETNFDLALEILQMIRDNADGDMEYHIQIVARDMKKIINDKRSEFYRALEQFVKNAGKETATQIFETIIKTCISAKIFSVFTIAFNLLDLALNLESYYKQLDAMEVYHSLSKTFESAVFSEMAKSDVEKDSFIAMCMLKALCEMRFTGEKELKDFIDGYVNGKYGFNADEETALKIINELKVPKYESVNEWYADITFDIAYFRDVIFNYAAIGSDYVPNAPQVHIDYETLSTVQSYSEEYEYCFGDGVWKQCKDEPISITLKSVPGTLRVRVAATDKHSAGKITTVRILAKKDLSKLISANFDGINYTLDNLSERYNYQIVFTDSDTTDVDWSQAVVVRGSDSEVTLSGIKEYNYMVLRSCQDVSIYETTSNPLSVIVSKKMPFDLKIEGKGVVTQNDPSGCYFEGDNIELIATEEYGYEFFGWYIGDECVSKNNYYIVEMDKGLTVTAKFDGPDIESISVKQLPFKLAYLEGENPDMNGAEVEAHYSDGSSALIKTYTAVLDSNMAGETSVIVSYSSHKASFDVFISHSETDWVITKQPTYTEDGLEIKYCRICQMAVQSEEIEKLICQAHDTEIVNVVEATCTSEGYTGDIVCNVCGNIISSGTVINALNHSLGDYIEIKAATCTTTGEERADCSRCDYYEVNAITVIGHIEEIIPAVDATCIKTGLTEGKRCSVCDESLVEQTTVEMISHSFKSVLTVPTCTSNGYITHTCTECSYNYVDNQMPASGHDYVNGVCINCGDSDNENCTCNCHKSGFFDFIWKILRFFYKLFKINSVCECGVAHY